MSKLQKYGKKGTKSLDRLIKRGFSLIVQKGAFNISLDDILKYCEITTGSFYYYFDSKVQFIDTCVMECYGTPMFEITHKLTEYSGNSFEDIYNFFVRIISGIQQHFDDVLGEYTVKLYDVISISILKEGSPLSEKTKERFNIQNKIQSDWVCNCLGNMQKSGVIRSDVDCPAIAGIIDKCWNGTMTGWWHTKSFESLFADWRLTIESFDKLLKNSRI